MKFIKVKLKDICTTKQWRNLPISALHESGKYKVYGANGVIGHYNEYNHEFPTLAITCRGATCGNIHITEPKSYITSNAMSLDDLDITKVDLKFLKYALLNRGFYDVITGSAQPQITATNLNKVDLLIPEKLEDQQKIACLLSQIEELINKREESIKLLDELINSTFLDMFGDVFLGDKFPKDCMKYIVKKIQIGPFGSQLHEKDYIFNGIPLINPRNIIKNKIIPDYAFSISESKYAELSNYHLLKNDIIMARRGEMGRCAIVSNESKLFCGTGSLYIRPNEKVNSLFLAFALSSRGGINYLEKKSQGVTMMNLNKKIIENINFCLPPKSLQNKFAKIVTQIENTKSIYQNSLTELNKLFGSIAQKAFKGELDVSKINLDIPTQEDKEMTLKLTEDNLIQEIKNGTFEVNKFVKTKMDYYDMRDMIFKMLEDGLIIQEVYDVEEINPEIDKQEKRKKVKLACKVKE